MTVPVLSSATFSGGTQPYSYKWNTESAFRSTNLLTNLGANKYWLTTLDNNGCSRVDTFTIQAPDSLYVNLGKDLTLCKDQSVTLNAAIPQSGVSYVWTESQSVKGTGSTLVVNSPGLYIVTATTAKSCVYRDSIRISQSAANISADFAAATQAFKDTLYRIVNTSSPSPDSVQWIFPVTNKISFLSRQPNMVELYFRDTGTYDIGIRSFLGACEAVKYSRIVVVDQQTTPVIITKKSPLIKAFAISPNPSSGNFNVNIELDSAATINLRLIDIITGKPKDIRSANGQNKYLITYTLAPLPTGIYILLLETPQESRTLKVIIN